MPERIHCTGVVGVGRNATLCERATQCQRWTEFQRLRRAESIRFEVLVCAPGEWRGFVGVGS